MPPFARPREVQLPDPYGKAVQYIIPHSETKTLAKALNDKNVNLIEVRGTWPKENMELVKALYNYVFLKNEKIKINEQEIGILDCISEYLYQSEKEIKRYGCALHVEVTGIKDGRYFQHTLTHTHPASDGSVEGWEGPRAYTRNVGTPMTIATELIAKGKVEKTGVIIPEEAFVNPTVIFKELEKRRIVVQEEIKELESFDDMVLV